MIDWYIDSPNALFSGGKYSALYHFCYAEFTAYYTIDNKPVHSSPKYQPDEFQDKLIEGNHEECGYPKHKVDEISNKNETLQSQKSSSIPCAK